MNGEQVEGSVGASAELEDVCEDEEEDEVSFIAEAGGEGEEEREGEGEGEGEREREREKEKGETEKDEANGGDTMETGEEDGMKEDEETEKIRNDSAESASMEAVDICLSAADTNRNQTEDDIPASDAATASETGEMTDEAKNTSSGAPTATDEDTAPRGGEREGENRGSEVTEVGLGMEGATGSAQQEVENEVVSSLSTSDCVVERPQTTGEAAVDGDGSSCTKGNEGAPEEMNDVSFQRAAGPGESTIGEPSIVSQPLEKESFDSADLKQVTEVTGEGSDAAKLVEATEANEDSQEEREVSSDKNSASVLDSNVECDSTKVEKHQDVNDSSSTLVKIISPRNSFLPPSLPPQSTLAALAGKRRKPKRLQKQRKSRPVEQFSMTPVIVELFHSSTTATGEETGSLPATEKPTRKRKKEEKGEKKKTEEKEKGKKEGKGANGKKELDQEDGKNGTHNLPTSSDGGTPVAKRVKKVHFSDVQPKPAGEHKRKARQTLQLYESIFIVILFFQVRAQKRKGKGRRKK